jgi:predicted phosphodiesterase
MPSRALKALSVSDRVDNSLLEQDKYEEYKDVDLILSCGDLPYYHIERLFQLYEVPVLYVRGNHDPRRSAPDLSSVNMSMKLGDWCAGRW